MTRCPCDIKKKIQILKDFYSSMGLTININKTKVMIIKTKKITYKNFKCWLYVFIDLNMAHRQRKCAEGLKCAQTVWCTSRGSAWNACRGCVEGYFLLYYCRSTWNGSPRTNCESLKIEVHRKIEGRRHQWCKRNHRNDWVCQKCVHNRRITYDIVHKWSGMRTIPFSTIVKWLSGCLCHNVMMF